MNQRKHANTSTDRNRLSRPRRTLCLTLGALLLAVLAGTVRGQNPPKSTPAPDPPANPRLVSVKRICVQNLGDDPNGILVQEMVIAKLFESRRFSLTENCDKADFILKGFVTERSDRAFRSETESVGLRASASASDSERAGSARTGTSASASTGLSDHETLSSTEVKQQAAVTLRLVDKDGEILWAFSSESTGGKTKGAIGDATDRAVRRFLREIERAEKQNPSGVKK